MKRLLENTVEKALHNFGLTEKEAQIYVYLAKHGVQKGGEISKKTRTAKAVVYRILKILHRKGFVESTLESPVRFKAVPFEAILDLEIKSKQEEARQIEKAKEELLTDWGKISKGEHESPVEKFVVLEGNQKIYSKMYQMIKQTKQTLSIISTVPEIMRSDHYGITNEIISHPLRDKINFRFLTDVTHADIASIRFLKKKLKNNAYLRGRNPELGLKPFPRMVIRDQEEILFFITPNGKDNNLKTKEVCLCTNCKSMIQAFSGVFEDLWIHSTNIERKIVEVQTGNLPRMTIIISDAEKAKRQYFDSLKEAEKEVLIVTSVNGLFELKKQTSLFEDYTGRNVAIKVMAPITNENLDSAQHLLHWCEIRHVPSGYFETTIIDEKYLFQFNNPLIKEKQFNGSWKFENTLYSNDKNQVQNTKNLLRDIWLHTRMPSSERPDVIISSLGTQTNSLVDHHNLLKRTSFMHNMTEEQEEKIKEKNILRMIEQEKKLSKNKGLTWSDTLRYFGKIATALIEPPKRFNLPRMVFCFCKYDEHSSFGSENNIFIMIGQKGDEGVRYVPSALILDSKEPMKLRKKMLKGFPAEDNLIAFRKDEIQFKMKGRTFFAGWTREIPLMNNAYTVPPSCVLFEGYGNIRAGHFNNRILSGRRQEVWYNSLNAFVTYFHPKAKYMGSGTEGYIEKDWVLVSKPPQRSRKEIDGKLVN